MAQVYEKERKLTREVAAAVENRLPDVEVLAVELGGRELLWIYIDHPEGVDHALCERVTGVLADFRRDYAINVSSPGTDRPLRTREHFRGRVGARASIRTATEIAGRRRFRGEIVDAAEDGVTLGVGDGKRVQVPYDAIARGNLIDEGR